VAKNFIKQWEMLIRQPVEAEEEELLVHVIDKFVNLASKLWCLKSDIRFQSLERFGGDVQFRVHSHEMAAAQVLALEDGSTRLDGRPIPLVVRPKIDASPRIGSKNTGQRIIWAKAIVWVSDQAEPEPGPRVAKRELSLFNPVTASSGDTTAMDMDSSGM
jgi:hypothetical protein